MDLKEFAKTKKMQLSNRIEFNPQGMTKYIENASESYGINLDPRKVVFILDDTVFGSGKDGCVIAISGIAFKSMLQRPVYFSFEKISHLEVSGRQIIINNNLFTYDFSIIDESDIAQVFETIQLWLKHKSNFKIDIDEYSEKISNLKSFLKTEIIPMVMGAVEEGEFEQEEAAEAISACIDDINEIERLIAQNNLDYHHAQYINNTIDLIYSVSNLMSDGIEFDDEILKAKSHDRYFGKFLKDMFAPIVEQIKKEIRKNNLMHKIQNF